MNKKKDILISVIVPCYNVEQYIVKCLDSIISQKQEGIEIIVVEDFSTDKTRDVIKNYISNNNANIVYIENQENRGAAYSRNVALNIANGEYIGFIDGDDYIGESYYQELYKAAKKNKADLVVADMNIIYENQKYNNYLSKATNGGLDKIDFINNGLAASPCNKLFSKKLVEKFDFLEGKMNEDIAVVIPAIVHAKKIAYVPDVQYNYVQRKSSVQNTTISKKRFDIFDAVDVCLKRIKNDKNYIEYKHAIVFNQIILFFIYVLPKEKSLFKRHSLLRTFHKLSKKYNIRKNPLLWNFINGQGKHHKYYYKLLFKTNCNGFHLITSFLMSSYNFWRDKIVKRVLKNNISLDDLIKKAKIQSKMKPTKKTISVIVPNYNYESFLLQRVYSILYQKVKINELILLDDCSSDNSILLLDEIYDALKPYINIRKVYNEINSGSAFKQWRKGFELAKSDYVWIAEVDDYCTNLLIKKLLKPILKDESIVISYADTAFIDVEGKVLNKSIKPEIDIMKTGHWDKSYVNNGVEEIQNYLFLNCTIANVSSVIFKNGNYDSYFELSGKYKQAGDWLFYVNIVSEGKIAYYNKPINYYTLHGNNVSSTTKKSKHLDEIKQIHAYIRKNYKLTRFHEKQIKNRYKFLERVWELNKENIKK